MQSLTVTAGTGGWGSSAMVATSPLPTGEVLLVGVAHVLDLRKGLQRTVADFHPDAVAVELDPERADSLVARERAHREGLEVSRTRRGQPLMFRAWGHIQDRLAQSLGDIPGAEMLQAAQLARSMGLPVYLIDDPLSQVAPRLVGSLSRRERLRLLLSSFVGLLVPARIVRRELEKYSEDRSEYLEILREQYPSVTRVLIDERNAHMAQRLAVLSSRHRRVMAVVGDAHVGGLGESLAQRGCPVHAIRVEELMDTRPAPAPGPAPGSVPPPPPPVSGPP